MARGNERKARNELVRARQALSRAVMYGGADFLPALAIVERTIDEYLNLPLRWATVAEIASDEVGSAEYQRVYKQVQRMRAENTRGVVSIGNVVLVDMQSYALRYDPVAPEASALVLHGQHAQKKKDA